MSEESISKYKELFEKDLDTRKKELPKSVKNLLEKLDPFEQLEWLNNPENTKGMERKKIPETPNGEHLERENAQPLPSIRF